MLVYCLWSYLVQGERRLSLFCTQLISVPCVNFFSYFANLHLLFFLAGTVRRFLEIHGETLEKVVFAVSELEEVSL